MFSLMSPPSLIKKPTSHRPNWSLYENYNLSIDPFFKNLPKCKKYEIIWLEISPQCNEWKKGWTNFEKLLVYGGIIIN